MFAGSEVRLAVVDALVKPVLEAVAEYVNEWEECCSGGDRLELPDRKEGTDNGWSIDVWADYRDFLAGGPSAPKCLNERIKQDEEYHLRNWAEDLLVDDDETITRADVRELTVEQLWTLNAVWRDGVIPYYVDPDQLTLPRFERVRSSVEWEPWMDGIAGVLQAKIDETDRAKPYNSRDEDLWESFMVDESNLQYRVAADYEINSDNEAHDSVYFKAWIDLDSWHAASWSVDVPLNKLTPRRMAAVERCMIGFFRRA